MPAQVGLLDGFDPVEAIEPCETSTAGGTRVELVTAEEPHEVATRQKLLPLKEIAQSSPQSAAVMAVPGTTAPTTRRQDHRPARSPRLSRLTGRVTNAHNAYNAIEGEQVFAHERRGTVWRAA